MKYFIFTTVILVYSLVSTAADSKNTALIFGRQELTLKAKSQGELVQIKVKEGEKVEANKVLAQIDSRRAKIDYEIASSEYKLSMQDYMSSKKLNKYISKNELRQKESIMLKKKSIKDLKALDLDNTRILAPTAGSVTKKYFDRGETVSIGDKVFDLVQLDELVLVANLDVGLAARIKVNEDIEFVVDGLGDLKFKAKIEFISPVIDAASETVRVRLGYKNIPKKDGSYQLRPGMLATLNFVDKSLK